MPTWTALTTLPGEAAANALAAGLERLAPEPTGIGVFEIEDGSGLWEVGGYFTAAPDGVALALLSAAHGAKPFTVSELPETDWVAKVRRDLTPVEAGRFFVYGSHDADKVPPGRIALLIEASMAFGTGHHGTTQGCLRAIDRLAGVDEGDRLAGVDEGDRLAGVDEGDRLAGVDEGDRLAGVAEGDRLAGVDEGDRLAGLREGDRLAGDTKGDRPADVAGDNRPAGTGEGARAGRIAARVTEREALAGGTPAHHAPAPADPAGPAGADAIPAPRAIADIGCGTAVLAMAAAHAWPECPTILATDIDEVAVEVAAANLAANGLTARIACAVATGFDHPRLKGPFDLILANILKAPLIALAPDMAAAAAPGGRAVLSGLLTRQSAEVLDAYLAAGFALAFREDLDGWTTLTLAKP